MLFEWSISFIAPGRTSSTLRSMRTDGTLPIDFWGTRISPGGSYILTPDGQTLIYPSGAATYSQQQGRPRTKIFDKPIGWIDVSRDGRKIAYTYNVAIPDPHIYVANIDGSGERRVTERSAPGAERRGAMGGECPSWSPDGHKILFTRLDGGVYYPVVMNADGTDPLPLMRRIEPSRDGRYVSLNFKYGKWSPDGFKIVAVGYSMTDGVPQEQIYVLNSSGAVLSQLTRGPRFCSSPCWSPNGTKILYLTQMGGVGTSSDDIFIMDADGTNQTNLTNTPSISEALPRWQPPIARLPLLGR